MNSLFYRNIKLNKVRSCQKITFQLQNWQSFKLKSFKGQIAVKQLKLSEFVLKFTIRSQLTSSLRTFLLPFSSHWTSCVQLGNCFLFNTLSQTVACRLPVCGVLPVNLWGCCSVEWLCLKRKSFVNTADVFPASSWEKDPAMGKSKKTLPGLIHFTHTGWLTGTAHSEWDVQHCKSWLLKKCESAGETDPAVFRPVMIEIQY